MRWDRNHVSPDVIDRRGAGGGGFGILGLLPLLIRSPLGWVGALVVVGGYFLYANFMATQPSNLSGDRAAAGAPPSEKVAFVSFVLDDVQDTWERKFAAGGQSYERAKLVVFTNSTRTSCGYGSAAVGPFYCPRDKRAYIDLGFYDQLKQRLGAPGDFAQAYVIAHEIGHHVQNLLGKSRAVERAPRSQQEGAGGLSVRLELQADCYAGVWGNSTRQRQLLDVGDLEEALGAAEAIGDDQLQRRGTGTVNPETWSHGSSAQRARWFRRGFDSGDPATCDTFDAAEL